MSENMVQETQEKGADVIVHESRTPTIPGTVTLEFRTNCKPTFNGVTDDPHLEAISMPDTASLLRNDSTYIDPVFRVGGNSLNTFNAMQRMLIPVQITAETVETMAPLNRLDLNEKATAVAKTIKCMNRLASMFDEADGGVRLSDIEQRFVWHAWKTNPRGRVVAITGIRLYMDESNQQRGILYFMKVMKSMRGSGYGSKILSYLNAQAAVDVVLCPADDYVMMSMLTTQYFYPIEEINTVTGRADEDGANLIVMKRDAIGQAGWLPELLQVNWATWISMLCQPSMFTYGYAKRTNSFSDPEGLEFIQELHGANSQFLMQLRKVFEQLDQFEMSTMIQRMIAIYKVDDVAWAILEQAFWLSQEKNAKDAGDKRYASQRSILQATSKPWRFTLPNEYHRPEYEHYTGYVGDDPAVDNSPVPTHPLSGAFKIPEND